VSANPLDWPKVILTHRHHWSAALVFMGIKALTGTMPRDFVFVAQEKEPPYVVQIVQLDRESLGWGMSEVRRAVRRFADLLAGTGPWPAYGEPIQTVGLPGWRIGQLTLEANEGLLEKGWELV
jgi:exodeoxyribonuclease VIII